MRNPANAKGTYTSPSGSPSCRSFSLVFLTASPRSLTASRRERGGSSGATPTSCSGAEPGKLVGVSLLDPADLERWIARYTGRSPRSSSNREAPPR